MHDASCSDRVDSLVRSMMADAAPAEPTEAGA
jgi:hypothetical protein